MTPWQFFDAVRSYCHAMGGSVTSYGRTKKHNAAVKGVLGSPHTVWLGADVVYDQPVTLESAKKLAGNLGLRIIEEPDHHHLQPADWRA